MSSSLKNTTFNDPRNGESVTLSSIMTDWTNTGKQMTYIEYRLADAKRRKNGNLDLRCSYTKELICLIDTDKRNKINKKIKIANKLNNELQTKIEDLNYIIKKQSSTIKEIAPNNNQEYDPAKNECLICSEVMKGKVELKCGHEVCPNCFAQHSRLANTCPFCRDEFSCKPKKQRESMPDEILNNIADQWADNVWGPIGQDESNNYFHKQLQHNSSKKTKMEKAVHLKWLVRENSKIIMKQMRGWYEIQN
tara:strand:+ start:8635 stop:9384 length:750 start_codon:yes stop_codon:yes gene_type:complete